MASRQLQNLLQAFLTVSMFKLVNASVTLAFSSSLVLYRILLVPHSTVPHTWWSSRKKNVFIASSSLVITPNIMMWIGCLFFISIGISCGDRASQQLFLSSPSDPGRNFSHPRKTKTCSFVGDAWVCHKSLQCSLSSCPLWSVIKICPFSSEKY